MVKKQYRTIQINSNTVRALKQNKNRLSKIIKNIMEFVKNNSLLVFLSFTLILGILFGAIFAKNADINLLKKLDFLFNTNYTMRSSQPLLETFSTSLVSSFIFILLSMLMGLSMWGVIIVPIIPFFKGFGLGVSTGYLYLAYGIQGVLFNLLVILPGMFLSSIALIIASKEAIRFSAILATTGMCSKRIQKKVPDLKIYLMKNSKPFIIIGACATVDMLFNWWFSGLFNF